MLCLVSLSFAKSKVNFSEGSIPEAFIKAKKENKKVFVLVYSTKDHFGISKNYGALVKHSYELGDLFNQHFVNVKVNSAIEENAELLKKYGMKGDNQSHLFFSKKGQLLHEEEIEKNAWSVDYHKILVDKVTNKSIPKPKAETNFKKALKRAKAENKLLYVHFYNSQDQSHINYIDKLYEDYVLNSVLEKYYVFAKIESKSAKRLLKKYDVEDQWGVFCLQPDGSIFKAKKYGFEHTLINRYYSPTEPPSTNEIRTLIGKVFFAQNKFNSNETLNIFEGSFEEAITKANSENKMVFVMVDSKTCPACKMFKKYDLTNPDVISYLNKNYICVIDTKNPTTYMLSAVPTIFFIRPKDQLALAQYKGSKGAELLFSFANESFNEQTREIPIEANLFTGSFEEAVKLAKKEKKKIFVQAYSKKNNYYHDMQFYGFREKTFCKYLNSNFITILIDTDSVEGQVFVNEYNEGKSNHLMLFSEQGKLIKKTRVKGNIPWLEGWLSRRFEETPH